METDREPIPRYSSVYTSLFDDKQFIIIEVHVIRVVYLDPIYVARFFIQIIGVRVRIISVHVRISGLKPQE